MDASAEIKAQLRLAKPAEEKEKGNLIEQVYARLKEDLFEFRLLPGERFSENEMANRMGVSRTPARVALYMLAREGYLIKTDGYSAWQVRPFDSQYFEDLYDVRVNLERIAFEKIAQLEPFPDLNSLRAIWLVPVEERSQDGKFVAERDEEFHSTLVQAAGNAEMARIHSDLTERIRIIRRLDFISPERIANTYVEHGKILRAVLARKKTEAQMLITSHIEQSKVEIRHISIHKLNQANARAKAGAATGQS